MNAFKIYAIQHGWFEICIGSYFAECSKYAGSDSPKELLKAALRLTENAAQDEWLRWPNEPDAVIMHISKKGSSLEIKLFAATKAAYTLPASGVALKGYCGECLGMAKEETTAFLDDMLTEFSLYENGNGLSLYKKHWEAFPEEEYHQLKKAVRSLAKQAGNKRLFFESY